MPQLLQCYQRTHARTCLVLATRHSKAMTSQAWLSVAAVAVVAAIAIGSVSCNGFVMPGVDEGRTRHCGCSGRSDARIIVSAEGDAQVKPKTKSFYNYFTNNWDSAPENAPMPWEDTGFTWRDLLPWSDCEVRALELVNKLLPNWREAFLTPKDEAGVVRRFRVLAEATGGEEAALAAMQRNIGVICVSEAVAQRAMEALVRNLGRNEAADVVRKNPGVLAIRASSLEGDGLASTVAVANAIDFFCGPGKILLDLGRLALLVIAAKLAKDLLARAM